MAADRMARGRRRTRQILAGHRPARHALRAPGRSGQTALAPRARLPGAETGTRPWTYEGRGWSGFHHHATLCIAAYAFLIAERARLPPSAAGDAADQFATPEISQNRPSRDPTGASRRELNLHHAPNPNRGPCPKARAMSVLHGRNTHTAHVVTQ